jgi:hypothetical protein
MPHRSSVSLGVLSCFDGAGSRAYAWQAMKRREFITLLGGAAAGWPHMARAQPSAMPVVGFLGPTSLDVFADRIRGFQRGLKEMGYVEGENLTIVYRWTEGQFDRLPTLAGELVRRQVAIDCGGRYRCGICGQGGNCDDPYSFYHP